ncbi:MAG: hypothetical protein AAGA10_23805 [Bacteroidota bacterium]
MRKYIFKENSFLTPGEIAQITGVPFQQVRSTLRRNRIVPSSDGKYSRECLSLIKQEYIGIQELEMIHSLARNERRISQREFIEEEIILSPSVAIKLAEELEIPTPQDGHTYSSEEMEALRRYARIKKSDFAYLLGEDPQPQDFHLPEDIGMEIKRTA